MKMPKNYTEGEFVAIVDKIMDYLAPLFTFGYYGVDDIRQEGFLYAVEALSRYDKTKAASLDRFLFTHIRNRLLNLKRNKLSRPNPCVGCEVSDCQEHCDKYKKWYRINSVKKELTSPNFYEVGGAEGGEDIVEKYCQVECLNIIDRELPLPYRKDFLRLIEGDTLQTFRRDRLYIEIKKVMAQHYPNGNYYD